MNLVRFSFLQNGITDFMRIRNRFSVLHTYRRGRIQRINPLFHLLQHPLDHHHGLGTGGGLVGLEAPVGIPLQNAGLDRFVHIPLHPVQDFLLVGKGQLPLHRLTGRVHQSKGPVRHQRDLIPGNCFLRPEILPIVVIRHHHAGVQRRVQPPLAGQPVAAHIVQLRRICCRPSPNILRFCMHFHPCHQLTVRRQVDRVQQHFCKLRTGDALLRLEAPVGVAVHPSRCNCSFYLLLGPMPLQI